MRDRHLNSPGYVATQVILIVIGIALIVGAFFPGVPA